MLPKPFRSFPATLRIKGVARTFSKVQKPSAALGFGFGFCLVFIFCFCLSPLELEFKAVLFSLSCADFVTGLQEFSLLRWGLGYTVFQKTEQVFRAGFAFGLWLFTSASLQCKAPNPHGPMWVRLPVLQGACSTPSYSAITHCRDYNAKYSGVQIKMLVLGRPKQPPGQISVCTG